MLSAPGILWQKKSPGIILWQVDFLYWTDVDEHRTVLNYLESWKVPFLVSVEIWNEDSIARLRWQGLVFNEHHFLKLLIYEDDNGLGKEKRKKIQTLLFAKIIQLSKNMFILFLF